MNTYCIIVSEHFPPTHPRAGEKTNFFTAIKDFDKLHTIRGNFDLWERRIEKINEGQAVLSVRMWAGKAYKSRQHEIFKFDRTNGVGIQKIENIDFKKGEADVTCIPGKVPIKIDKIAKNDGLATDDFHSWFNEYDLSKPMAIIHFTRFRYDLYEI